MIAALVGVLGCTDEFEEASTTDGRSTDAVTRDGTDRAGSDTTSSLGEPDLVSGDSRRPDTGGAEASDAAPPRPTRGLVEHVDFEDESTEIYTGPGEAGVPDIDEALTFPESPAGDGSRSLRVHIESDWDFSGVDRPRVNPTVTDSDARRLQSNGYSVYGLPFWTGFVLYVPPNWQPDSIPERIARFARDVSRNTGESLSKKYRSAGAVRGSGTPLALRIEGNELKARNDTLPQGVEFFDPSYRDEVTLATLESGTRIEIVMKIRWSNQNDPEKGLITIWVDGEVAYDSESENVVRDVEPPRPLDFGVDKPGWEDGTAEQTSRTYLFDEFRFATEAAEFATVAP